MRDVVKPICEILKSARLKKGLSQHALAKKVGVPQSHISKIENGKVDLQTSSLIEFSRILDLELMLVPRQLVSVVQALQKDNKSGRPIPAYRLEDDDENE